MKVMMQIRLQNKLVLNKKKKKKSIATTLLANGKNYNITKSFYLSIINKKNDLIYNINAQYSKHIKFL